MGKLELMGRTAWPTTLEQMLEGITHQLSNRVALLAGVSEILAGDQTVPPVLRALADEVPKLEETIRLLRLLATPADEMDEPIQVSRPIEDAIALARLHPEIKDAAFTIVGAESAPPVLARPVWFTRDILLGLVAVATAGDPSARLEIPVTAVEEGDFVRVTVGEENSRSAVSLRVPTLAAGRRGVTA